MTIYLCDLEEALAKKYEEKLKEALGEKGRFFYQDFQQKEIILDGSYTLESLAIIIQHMKEYLDEYARIHAEQTPAGTGGDGSRSI